MNRTRWLATAAAGIAVVVGGGVALAAGGSSDPSSDFLGDVAKRLGVGQDDLKQAIEDATIARIDEAVADGDISKEDAEALKKRVRSGDAPAILPGFRGKGLGVGPLGLGGPKPRLVVPGHLPGGDLIGAAADYLDMTRAEVVDALRNGQSLADLAKTKGKSVDGLKDALRSAITEDADEAVDELVERSGGPGLEFGPPGKRFGPLGPPKLPILPGVRPGADLMDTAADYLSMDAAELRRALARGRSPAELAKERGKSVDGLKDALHAAIREDADKAVDDGDLTRKQADELVEELGRVIDNAVDGGLNGAFGFRFKGGNRDGDFEFHLRVGPADRTTVPGDMVEPSLESEARL
jgi:lambda repressor-like predicted transcriptional regulator